MVAEANLHGAPISFLASLRIHAEFNKRCLRLVTALKS